MATYMIFTRLETKDSQELETYEKNVGSTLNGHRGNVVVSHGELQVLEGPAAEGIVILEFLNKTEALQWYQSDAYQEVAQHRFNGAVYSAIMVEGV